MKACEGVFAAGDIAHFPLKMLNDDRVSIGHWQISHKHGTVYIIGILGIADVVIVTGERWRTFLRPIFILPSTLLSGHTF